MKRPGLDDCHEYYHTYVRQVPDGDVLDTLESKVNDTVAFWSSIDDAKALHRYADGKWSIKEVAGHVTDVERVFGLRALSFARGEKQPLPGMDQDEYVAGGNFDDRSLTDIAEEFRALRASHVRLFRSLSADAWARRGTASDVEFATFSIPWILAGHEAHHNRVIREKYLET